MHYEDDGLKSLIVFRDIGDEVRSQIEKTGKSCGHVHREMAPYLAGIFDVTTTTMLGMMNSMINGHIYQTTSSSGLEYHGDRHRGILSVYLAALNKQDVDVQPVVRMIRDVDDAFVYPPTEEQIEKARYR